MGRRRSYSVQKRRREADKQRKRRDKAERRTQKRAEGSDAIEIATAEEIQGGALLSPDEVLAQAIGQAVEPRGVPAMPVRLFVAGLSWDTNSEQLRAAFGDVAPVIEAVVVTDSGGDSRGFGFVTIAGRKEAAQATKRLDGAELDGRTIAVRPAA